MSKYQDNKSLFTIGRYSKIRSAYNQMNPTNVFWLMDEVFAQTHPKDWQEAVFLSTRLMKLIGNKNFVHSVVNPIESYRKAIAKTLEGDGIDPTVIIDISRWLTPGVKTLFPNTEITKEFSLSRVIDVSTVDFQTAGYISNIPFDDVSPNTENLDLSRPLLVDDTGVTGGTLEMTMKAFGVRPEDATTLLLLGNTGFFPNQEGTKAGAVGLLGELGTNVIYGDTLDTPSDDAEHLSDILRNLETFPLARRLRQTTTKSQGYAEGLDQFLKDEGANVLFPRRVESDELTALSEEGRFRHHSSYVAGCNPLYSRNPSLWTFHDFWKKIDEPALIDSNDQAMIILQRLHSLKTNAEGRFEVGQRLKMETESIMAAHTAEKAFKKNIER